mgnify:CR=1 FL=1
MASMSQNLERTYRNLASSWNKKCGTRDHKANIFENTNRNDQVYHVAAVLCSSFNSLHEKSVLLKEFQVVAEGDAILSEDSNAMWIYDMRKSDSLPRTPRDMERLYTFVRKFVKGHFDVETRNYLLSHDHISVCFFIWFFTTPDFFYHTKDIRQTSRHGIKKCWTRTLLDKQPIVVVPKRATHKVVERGDMHQKVMLGKVTEHKKNIEMKITELICGEHPGYVLDWEDAYGVRRKISECMKMNSEVYINGKKGKKLQKLYQDYQKVAEKVKHTGIGIKTAEAVLQAKMKAMVLQNSIVGEADEKAENPVETTEALVEEVPESWEDLI